MDARYAQHLHERVERVEFAAFCECEESTYPRIGASGELGSASVRRRLAGASFRARTVVAKLAVSIDGGPEQPTPKRRCSAAQSVRIDAGKGGAEPWHAIRRHAHGDGRPIDGLIKQFGREALLRTRRDRPPNEHSGAIKGHQVHSGRTQRRIKGTQAYSRVISARLSDEWHAAEQ